jgi:integration host factor subunit beta
MNKLELIKKLMEECQISKKEAATIVNLFFGEISEGLAKSDRVEIRGSCSFSVKEYNLFYTLKDGSNNSISP